MPTAIAWMERAEGSWFRRTHQIPPFQKGVALPVFTQRLARAGVVGMSDALW